MKPAEFEEFASELAMALWNQLAHTPHFNHLRPRDYPDFYDAVNRSLEPLVDIGDFKPLNKDTGGGP
jgi:hypothetical protein